MSETFRTVVAIAVCGVWLTASMVSIFTEDFKVLGAVTPVMMVVVGFIFGFKRPNGVAK